jgi:hypothetical protein
MSAWTNRPLTPGSIDGPQTEQTVEGVLLLKDRWQVARPLAISAGARYSYAGFLDDPHHVDPLGTIEWSPAKDASLRASVRVRTLVPGGGSLSLSLFDPVIPATGGARLAHSLRYEVLAQCGSGSTSFVTRAFQEDIRDPFVNALLQPFGLQARTVPIGRRLALRGMGASVSQRLGGIVEGTFSYSLGLAERTPVGDAGGLLEAQGLLVPEGTYHNFVGRLATRIDPTETSVVAFSRLVAAKSGARFRYEVQVRQVVPFVARRTGTEWTVVIAVRNLLQEPDEDDSLTEMAEARPPRRLIGGVSVRF